MEINQILELIDYRIKDLEHSRSIVQKKIDANGGRYSGNTAKWEQIIKIDAKLDELKSLKAKIVNKLSK